MNKKLVDYQESPSIKAGRFLLSRGFDPASRTGLAEESLVESRSLGILRKNPEAKPRKYLFGLITGKPRRWFLGKIWFNEDKLGATEQNWVIEVYGREHIEMIQKLADDMASTFNIKIAIRLVRDLPHAETYSYEAM